MTLTTREAATGPEQGPGHQDFLVIDAHLKRAHQSHKKAFQLFANGRLRDALTQSQLTRIFIHNALSKINRQCEGRDA